MISQVVTSHRDVSSQRRENDFALPLVRAEFCDFDEFILSFKPDVHGGCVFLELEHSLAVGQKVHIEFSMTSSQLIFLKGLGIVMEIVGAESGAQGLLISFFDLDDKSKKLLSQALRTLSVEHPI